ncbi:MAG: helix-turn-helix transcriptional regulator [Cypionkella sp.]
MIALPARRPTILVGLLLMQAAAAVYFVIEASGELLRNPTQAHPLTEVPVALALAIGIAFSAAEVWRTLRRMREQEAALAEVKGAFGQVVSNQFSRWSLTPAERAVGLMALKGMEVADIAERRSAATGTVRAQLTRIYAKAGVAGRAQFAAFFVEDLLAEGFQSPGF